MTHRKIRPTLRLAPGQHHVLVQMSEVVSNFPTPEEFAKAMRKKGQDENRARGANSDTEIYGEFCVRRAAAEPIKLSATAFKKCVMRGGSEPKIWATLTGTGRDGMASGSRVMDAIKKGEFTRHTESKL